MAGWPVPWGGDVLEETDGASGLFGGGYERYGVGPRDGSALAGPLDLPSGKIAVLGDPQGAAFAIFEGETDD